MDSGSSPHSRDEGFYTASEPAYSGTCGSVNVPMPAQDVPPGIKASSSVRVWLRNLSPLVHESPPAGDSRPEDATFVDLLGLVVALIIALAGLSYIYYRSLDQEVQSAEGAVRNLREKDATLEQKLSNILQLKQLTEADERVPHPKAEERDANFIGTHADVSWQYNTNHNDKYLSYELELWRNRGRQRDCKVSSDSYSDLTGLFQEFWKGCGEGPVRFVTSDSGSRRSRIPPDLEQVLPSGSYSWRVAPMRAGSKVGLGTDDANLVSDWSEFSSFTIHESLSDRLLDTHQVRVGTNFSQDTHFSRRNESGYEVGFDISLIRTLIEGCLNFDRAKIKYAPQRCREYIGILRRARDIQETQDRKRKSCSSSSNVLCVKFIPVGSWGDWQTLLRRREIDLFIGSVTRATARRHGGIIFTNGYLRYETKFYAHVADALDQSPIIGEWLKQKRVVGVIKKSSNEDLLDRLTAEDFKNKIKKFPFESYPDLEGAMERGELDGLIIDDTFVSHHSSDWIALNGLQETKGWHGYMKEFIGPDADGVNPGEQIAIATVLEDANTKQGLYGALQLALESIEVRNLLLPELCGTFWRDSPDICKFAYKEK